MQTPTQFLLEQGSEQKGHRATLLSDGGDQGSEQKGRRATLLSDGGDLA